jgi:hypothetical protein
MYSPEDLSTQELIQRELNSTNGGIAEGRVAAKRLLIHIQDPEIASVLKEYIDMSQRASEAIKSLTPDQVPDLL